jgi:hypothetical protein
MPLKRDMQAMQRLASPETVASTSVGASAASLVEAQLSESRVSIASGSDGLAKGDLAPPDGELPNWTARVLDAFGTLSPNFAALILSQLIALIGGDEQCEVHVNAALAVVDGLKPRNEAEALLALQMVAAHLGAMRCLSLSGQAQQLVQFQVHGELANKFMRTYALHLETLSKLRRGGEQNMKVEHVYVYQGGQAVVGDINVSRGEGVREIDRQPHAPGSAALVSSEKVRSEDAVGRSLSGASNQRKAKVPHARRQVARRAKRK